MLEMQKDLKEVKETQNEMKSEMVEMKQDFTEIKQTLGSLGEMFEQDALKKVQKTLNYRKYKIAEHPN